MDGHGAARLLVACVVCAGVALLGFSGPYNLLAWCVVGGLVAGSPWAPLVLPVVAVLPAWFVDTGTRFHADGAADYLLGALVVFGGGGIAAAIGVLLSFAADNAVRSLHRRLVAPG